AEVAAIAEADRAADGAIAGECAVEDSEPRGEGPGVQGWDARRIEVEEGEHAAADEPVARRGAVAGHDERAGTRFGEAGVPEDFPGEGNRLITGVVDGEARADVIVRVADARHDPARERGAGGAEPIQLEDRA